jgi:cytoskeletal protein RodZ
VSMRGIGPRSEAYESSVLPLNYTDNKRNIAEFGEKRNLLVYNFNMKKLQKGFVVPLVLIIIALAIVGIYWSTQAHDNTKLSTSTSTPEVNKTINQDNSKNQSTQTTNNTTNNQSKLSINSVNPSSGPIGIKITITGEGFVSTANTVHFGLETNTVDAMGTIYTVTSSSNNTLVFQVPANDKPMCPESSPQCPIRLPTPITPGIYYLFISNANGKSNTLTFKVE